MSDLLPVGLFVFIAAVMLLVCMRYFGTVVKRMLVGMPSVPPQARGPHGPRMRNVGTDPKEILAAELGLDLRHDPNWFDGGTSTLAGMRDGVAVEVHFFTCSSYPGSDGIEYRTRLSVSGAGLGLAIKPRPNPVLNAAWRVLTGGQNHVTGDTAFDDAMIITGWPKEISGMLDDATRGVILEHLEGRDAELKDGVLVYECEGHLVDHAELASRLDNLVQLVNRLPPLAPATVDEKLAKNIREDRHPGVRLRCLQLLDGPLVDPVARKSLDDPNGGVRLQAAILRDDAAMLAAATPEDLLRVASSDPERLVDALLKAGLEQGLIDLLGGEPSVRVKAARALAEVGSVRAVAALRPLTVGLLADEVVVSAAARAIERIQDRGGGGGPGRGPLQRWPSERGRG